ncbi:MAG: cation diffusion facilitator family transporter [Ignavibacteria bacterium]|nr:cation diffusion facilitator family transporter [Ignavibacteria bacterium]
MSHNHNHGQIKSSNALIIGIVLNTAFIVIEVVFGLISNSVALISDAGHNFSDVISLILALIAAILIKTKTNSKFTYGYKKGSIIIALFNAILLLFALGVIVHEAIHRITNPDKVDGLTVIIVAFIGIVINGLTAFLFLKDKDKDLNIKSAFLHMLTDTLVSASVVISGVLIYYYGIYWLDPLLSIAIAIVVFVMTWKLLIQTIKLSIDAVPDNINTDDVYKYLMSIDNVKDVHDLHIWSLSTSEIALTAHIVLESADIENFKPLREINEELHRRFEIVHPTIQIENIDDFLNCKKC